MKNIMTRAWEIAREAVKNFGGKIKEFFGGALKMAWEESKEEKMAIKEWFVEKLQNEKGGFLVEILGVMKETEKALLLLVEWGYTSSLEKRMEIWVPKSAMTTEKEIEEEKEARWAEADANLKYNEMLLEYAKSCQIKGVRKFMKTATLIKKIKEAGLAVPTK